MDCKDQPENAPAASSTSSLTHTTVRVVGNTEVCPGHYLMELGELGALAKPPNAPRPGQFFHILCDSAQSGAAGSRSAGRGPSLTLRRPLAAHRIHYYGLDRKLLAQPEALPQGLKDGASPEVTQIDFLYKLVGKGTGRLSGMAPGQSLDLLGPIGNGFAVGSERSAVIVAGGVGLAPLMSFAEQLRRLDFALYAYFGALTKEQLTMVVGKRGPRVSADFAGDGERLAGSAEEEFTDIGATWVRICTDDGSAGAEGRVSDVLADDVSQGKVSLPGEDTCFYTCGPRPMMQAVTDVASSIGARCQVLLEERMACGVGACYSCVCDTRTPDGELERKRACIDGPVFDGATIVW